MLIALVSAQRAQTISLLDLSNMVSGKSSYIFYLSDHIKQSRLGFKPQVIKLTSYAPNKALCVCHTLQHYLFRTEPLRGMHVKLFISFHKPHQPLSKETISVGG